MKLRHRSAMHRCECDCCTECADKIEFKKIVQSEDIGLAIYQYTPQTQDEKHTTGEVFILRNTKHTKVTTDDLAAVFEQNVVTCPRCLKNIAKAEIFLRNIPEVGRDELTGVCDHCVRKKRPLSSICKCKDVVDKFLVEEQDRRKDVKAWLDQVRHQLNKSPDYRQKKELQTFSRSEISLDTAVSKFSEINYKHFAEYQLRRRMPSARAASSLDSLREVDQCTPKEFEHFFTPMQYLKEKYDRRRPQETKLPDSIFSDTQEYIDRVSPDASAKGPASPEFMIKDSDNILAGKKLERFDSYLDMPKEPEHEIKHKRGREDEKPEHRRKSILREAPAPADRGGRKSSFPPPPWKKHSDESFLKAISGKVPKVFSFSFPHDAVEKKQIGKRQASSSELIKNTQDMLQAKAEEEKRKKEEEIKIKREEEERKKQEREKKREEALAAKAAKAAFEEKKRQEAKLDKQILEEEKRKDLEKDISLVSVTEKLEANKNTPNTSLSSKQKSDKGRHKMPSDKTKKVIDKEELGTEKTSRRTKGDKLEDKETIKKDKVHRDVRAEDKQTKTKENLQGEIKKSKLTTKEAKEEEKNREREGKSDKENKQKMDKEKKYDVSHQSQTKEPKQKITEEKITDGDKSQIKEPIQKISEGKKSVGDKSQTKEPKQKISEEKKSIGDKSQTKEPKQKISEEKKSVGDKSQKKEPEKKITGEKKPDGDQTQTKEPKGKTDKTDRLENETLKALLASQQKEKQEQERMMKEQQKEEELARKKAMDVVKSLKAEDKSVKEDQASKLQKLKEMAEIQRRPPKNEEAPTTKELALRQVKMMRSSDDLMLKLVKLQKEENKMKLCDVNPVIIRQHGRTHKKKRTGCVICSHSDLALEFDEFEMQQTKMKIEPVEDVIIGEKIFKSKTPFKIPQDDFDVQGDNFNAQDFQEPQVKEPDQVALPAPTTKTKNDAVDPEASKGVIRYALSDRSFIEKGWTMLPTEKVVRKMNVYRMRPAHPEFDWFEHNKYKRMMQYDCGAKLAEFDDNGRGRWYYRSGKLALDYYDAEELNAQQRFVVYSSGEPDERGRTRPRTILAAFDYLGNGVVFDHTGKIRLKYNQTEGVVLDRSIGPASHWKWHTLNDPPVLQQVMIDTQLSYKDPRILQLGEKNAEKAKIDNEEMLAIEFDNFIKEKSRKLTQKFKPFQIKMKALKINEYFSLRVLDQATVYLLFRDGTTNLKINMGMILDHKEIVDTETAEVGEVSNSLERLPARTDSIAALQEAVAAAQRQERARARHERRLRPTQPCASADQLRAGASRPLRPPLVAASSTGIQCHPHCPNRFKKPSSSNLYYDTRL